MWNTDEDVMASSSASVATVRSVVFDYRVRNALLQGWDVRPEDDICWICEPGMTPIGLINGEGDVADNILMTSITSIRNNTHPAVCLEIVEELGMSDHWKEPGLQILEIESGMAASLKELDPELCRLNGVRIEEVTDGVGLAECTKVLVEGRDEVTALRFVRLHKTTGDPTLKYFCAKIGSTPVAVCVLFLSSNAASVWSVTTVPQARGKGIGTAITATAFVAAREMGYAQGVLSAYPAAKSMYSKLGLKEYCRWRLYKYRPMSALR